MSQACIYHTRVEDLVLLPFRYDAIFCDPPYGLEFMGRGWDKGVPPVEVWKKLRRSLKPGGWLLAFGGTRTWHRLTTNIEDAGFEIRDCLMWLYGTGFPKGMDVSKGIDRAKGAKRELIRHKASTSPGPNRGKINTRPWLDKAKAQGYYDAAGPRPVTKTAKRWDGYGTALKPAWEPIIMAQKPMDPGGFSAAAIDRGVGGINIDASRIGSTGGCKADPAYIHDPGKRPAANCYREGLNWERSPKVDGLGRFPTNVLMDEDVAAQLDAQSGHSKSRRTTKEQHGPNYKNKIYGVGKGGHMTLTNTHSDEGGASRFFWVSKVSPAERGDCKHETMKPIRLCTYLAQMILPPPGEDRRLLVPFSGSGSEMIGGLRAGFESVAGIEQDQYHVMAAYERLEREEGVELLWPVISEKLPQATIL